jgi:hypothetical protein
MRCAAIIGPTAVTTEYWEQPQPDGTVEVGCRLQIRRVRTTQPSVLPPDPQPDAVFWSIEEPIWRADLFNNTSGASPWDAAHYHPTFSGVVPCERVYLVPALTEDPIEWIHERLMDVPAMVIEAGHPGLAESLSRQELDLAIPLIESSIRAIFAYRPSDVWVPPAPARVG